MAYIEMEKAIAEIDKGDLLVGNNAEWAKEIIRRTPTADVVPKAEVEKIFEEIDILIVRRMIPEVAFIDDRLITDIAELKKKYIGDKK